MPKSFENVRQEVGRYTAARIPNGHLRRPTGCRHRYVDGSTNVREFHRVGHDVQEDLPQPVGVGKQRRELVDNRETERHVLFVGHRFGRVHDVMNHLAELHDGRLDRQGR